jgi:hypothetical protein
MTFRCLQWQSVQMPRRRFPFSKKRGPLQQVSLFIETEDEQKLDAISTALADMACPHPVSEPHKCPDRWLVVTTLLPRKEARRWRKALNE